MEHFRRRSSWGKQTGTLGGWPERLASGFAVEVRKLENLSTDLHQLGRPLRRSKVSRWSRYPWPSFQHLAHKATPKAQAIRVKADQVADALGLDGEGIDELVVGLSS